MATRWLSGIGALILLAVGAARHSMAADAVDPALAPGWAFMQQAMPGTSYDLLKGACAEGSLMIYHGTWTDAQQMQVAKFNQRFPCVKVQMLELEPAPMRTRFLAETRANNNVADIIQDSDPGTLDVDADQGLLMKYGISNEASYSDAVKRTGFWYPLRAAMVGMAWNTNLVTPERAKILSDWKGGANPLWAGHMGVVDPAGGGVGFSPWYAWSVLYGDDFFKQIGALKPRVFGGTNPASAALASGDIWVSIGASETGLIPLYVQGAPIQWSLPEPGIGPVTGQAISAKAPHPNAAKLYQEYAFTLEGYQAWQALGGAPARIGYKDQRKVASASWYKYPTKFFEYKTADSTAANKRIVDLFHTDIGAFR